MTGDGQRRAVPAHRNIDQRGRRRRRIRWVHQDSERRASRNRHDDDQQQCNGCRISAKVHDIPMMSRGIRRPDVSNSHRLLYEPHARLHVLAASIDPGEEHPAPALASIHDPTPAASIRRQDPESVFRDRWNPPCRRRRRPGGPQAQVQPSVARVSKLPQRIADYPPRSPPRMRGATPPDAHQPDRRTANVRLLAVHPTREEPEERQHYSE